MRRSQTGPSRILYPNFGAEENRDAKRAVPELLHLLALWQGLFPPDTAAHLPVETFPPGTTPLEAATVRSANPNSPTKTVEARPSTRSLRTRLAGTIGIVPWYPTARAAEFGATRGEGLAFSSPADASRLHDKASCVEWLERADRGSPGSVSKRSIGWWPVVLTPEELRRPGAATEIARIVSEWDEVYQRTFVLKPRFGTSGRGRVRADSIPLAESVARALPKLADRGGAILEPWFERLVDLSAQFWVEVDGSVTCLGTTRQVLGENGIYLGNRGNVDFCPESLGDGDGDGDGDVGGCGDGDGGRCRGGDGYDGCGCGAWNVSSGSSWDAEFREVAGRFVRSAADAGFRGPCGVDGFSYRDARGEERLRPLVECNARFTAGLVALGWLAEVLDMGARTAESGGSSTVGGPFEWWFVPFPSYSQRLLGDQGLASRSDGWEVTPLEEGDGAGTLSIRSRGR